ncbi:unnamed protein product [Caenorhabditis brenneri]
MSPLILLLFAFLFSPTIANEICTNDFYYNTGYHGYYCWKVMSSALSQTDADEECKKQGGAALTAINGFYQNLDFSRMVARASVAETWLGLVCNASTPTSCYWTDDREDLTAWNNFRDGSPNTTIGECVVLDTSDKTWFSKDCGAKTRFTCELPPTTSDDNCPNNYNRHCYTVHLTPKKFEDAQSICEQNCGNLVSVHSELENRYITTLFSDSGTTSLGGIAPSKVTILWNDYSTQVYSNIRDLNSGSCVYMDVGDGTDGHWYTDICSKETWFVCKRPTGLKCEL